MIGFTLLVGLCGIIGGICGVWSLLYVKKQTDMMAKDIKNRNDRDAEDDQWAHRFEQLRAKLLRVNPVLQVQEPGRDRTTVIYPTMYPDARLRQAIEAFIVQLKGMQFEPRHPQPHEFSSPEMRRTIERAEAEMKEFLEAHPFCRQHLIP